jgi:hypothetical protein
LFHSLGIASQTGRSRWICKIFKQVTFKKKFQRVQLLLYSTFKYFTI